MPPRMPASWGFFVDSVCARRLASSGVKARVILIAVLVLLGAAGLAQASGSIATATIYSPLPVSTGACYIRNVGKTPVTLNVQISGYFDGSNLVPSFQNCNDAPLPAGATCVVLVDLSGGSQAGCVATATSGSAKNLRGTLELRSSSGGGLHVVDASDLR